MCKFWCVTVDSVSLPNKGLAGIWWGGEVPRGQVGELTKMGRQEERTKEEMKKGMRQEAEKEGKEVSCVGRMLPRRPLPPAPFRDSP